MAKMKARDKWRQIKHIDDTVEHIVRGLSAGVAVGLIPLFGLQMLIAAGITRLLRGNIAASISGTFVSNPLTYIPLYLFNLEVGMTIMHSLGLMNKEGHHITDIPDRVQNLKISIWQLSGEYLAMLFIGSVIVAALGFMLTYILARPLIRYYQHQRHGVTDADIELADSHHPTDDDVAQVKRHSKIYGADEMGSKRRTPIVMPTDDDNETSDDDDESPDKSDSAGSTTDSTPPR